MVGLGRALEKLPGPGLFVEVLLPAGRAPMREVGVGAMAMGVGRRGQGLGKKGRSGTVVNDECPVWRARRLRAMLGQEGELGLRLVVVGIGI